jgi:hypothetical protein
MHNKHVIFAADAQAVEITEFARFLVVTFGTSLQSYRIIRGTSPTASTTLVSAPAVVPSPAP